MTEKPKRERWGVWCEWPEKSGPQSGWLTGGWLPIAYGSREKAEAIAKEQQMVLYRSKLFRKGAHRWRFTARLMPGKKKNGPT